MTTETLELVIRHGIGPSDTHYVAGKNSRTGESTGAFSIGDVTVDPNKLVRRVGDMGLPIKRSVVIGLVEAAAREEPCFRVVETPGWQRDQNIAWGTRLFTPKGEAKSGSVEFAFANYDPRTIAKFRTHGTLEEWQTHIGKYMEGNSRCVLACGLAFAAPLLRIVDVPPCGGFQFVGPSGRGKTSALIGASSITGHKADSVKAAVEDWLNSATWIEKIGLCHADQCIFLDETHQAKADKFKDGLFRLSQSEEMGRATNTGSTRTYRVVFMSSSNKTVAQILKGSEENVDEAFLSRVLDVPFATGEDDIFDIWHDFSSGRELADHLKAAANRYYGTPMVRYLGCLAAHRAEDEAELRAKIAKRMDVFRERVMRDARIDVSNYGRAIDRGGLAYAGLALAIEYGVIPWDRKEALADIVRCLVDGLVLAAKTTGERRKDPKTRVREYLRKNEKRLHDLDAGYPNFTAKQIGDVPGYQKESSGGRWAYLTVATMEKLVPTAKERKALMRELVADGLSEPPTEGQIVQRKLFDRGQNKIQRVYSFAFDFFSSKQAG